MEHTVAIVGRPNVGKSALFNCLAGRDISLVFDRPGTTRDRMVTAARWDGHRFTLIDTGGIGLDDSEGFADAIDHEVDLALAAATEIIFVVDAREGLTPLDQTVARLLRKSRCPVFVAANKVDGDKQANLDGEFLRLGFKGVFPVSAAHRRGLDELREAVVSDWSAPVEIEEPAVRPARPTRLAIVGRPNVGKSSLINALIAEPRAIVSEVAGTTRDAVDIAYTWRGEPFLFIDTAGMRQERRMHDALERAMTGRTAHAINRADVCILVIDASTGVTMQDKKIAGLIQEAHAPCMIVVNKWDLAREQGDAGKTREREYYDQVKRDIFFLSYAPVLFLSAKSGERIDGLLKTCATIAKNRVFRFQTGPLNRVISRAMEKYAPPLVHGRRFKVLYAAQQAAKEGAREIPTLQLFVNSPALLTPAYERYLDLQIRESFELRGCPLRFVLRGRATGAREKTRSQIKHNPPPKRRAPKRGSAKSR
ncbi:MAG TPA: ribosome biogenesis GTPase Der [Candidatus Methylacidiphilales bacterium]|jgi:GTP-binding protein|nr:ribosome biogenesis GTPase Der [Candidatus Methylacidiphilales bacterium]